MQQDRPVEYDALAEAAMSRARMATASGASTRKAMSEVKDAVKAFNREIVSIPDYLHYHPQYILDALLIIQKICVDLITYRGKSPKDVTEPVRPAAAAIASPIPKSPRPNHRLTV